MIIIAIIRLSDTQFKTAVISACLARAVFLLGSHFSSIFKVIDVGILLLLFLLNNIFLKTEAQPLSWLPLEFPLYYIC